MFVSRCSHRDVSTAYLNKPLTNTERFSREELSSEAASDPVTIKKEKKQNNSLLHCIIKSNTAAKHKHANWMA